MYCETIKKTAFSISVNYKMYFTHKLVLPKASEVRVLFSKPTKPDSAPISAHRGHPYTCKFTKIN